jgi:NADH-quinone oxidoreductase subunit H
MLLLFGLGAVTAGIALWALFAIYAERKLSAFIQDRLGPMEVGPAGVFQTLADVLKLLQKEIILPTAADRPLFLVAPVLIFASIFAGFAVIPFFPDTAGAVLNLGLLYLLAIISVEVVGLLMAGWGSNNKYSLLGSVRAVSQIVSYEVPAGLTLLAGVLLFGSLNLHSIVQQQGVGDAPVLLWGLWDVRHIGGITTWTVVRYPHMLLGLLIFFVSSLAESNRAPFDIPEAESELIAGYQTEYAGMAFGVIMLGEYANMLLLSLLASILFLGGWQSPLPNLGTTLPLATWTTGPLWGVLWLLGKGILLVLVMMWVRWSYPRLRADQLMKLCWKYLTPTALALVLISAVWHLAEVGGGG